MLEEALRKWRSDLFSLALSQLSSKARPRMVNLFFFDRMIRGRSRLPSSTVPSGKLAELHAPQALPSNPYKLGIRSSLTKALGNTTRRLKSSTNAQMNGREETLAYLSALAQGRGLVVQLTDSPNGMKISWEAPWAASQRREGD